MPENVPVQSVSPSALALPPGWLARHWPGPRGAAGRTVLTTAGATGLVAAVSLPVDRPGVGWLVAGLAATVATHAVRGPRGARIGWAAASVALLGVGTVRAAGWLFVLCVLAACVTGSLAVGGGRTVAGLVRGAFAVPFSALRALPWAYRGARTTGHGPVRLVATLAVSAALLMIFGGLFASADVAFAGFLDGSTPDLDAAAVYQAIYVFAAVGLGTLGTAYLLSAPPDLDAGSGRAHRTLARIEWALPVALLDLLFAGFVLVQVTVLFGGADHVLRTADLTYAEYARRGFWQLLVVTVLTLAVIGAAARWAPPEDGVLVRVLLGALAALTLVIVASALFRMHVYEEAYGFTRLRVFVQATELWLGALFVMVLVAGIRLRAAWLPRAVVASAVVALLALAVLNPDRFIADRNIDRYRTTGRIDVLYLGGLSADGAPALDRLPAHERACALWRMTASLDTHPDGWRAFNAGRATARRILRDRPAGLPYGCWALDRAD